MTDVKAVRRDTDVSLGWSATVGASAYNVWTVADKTTIPMARRMRKPGRATSSAWPHCELK